jgi:NADH oxidase (H2O2-forming)
MKFVIIGNGIAGVSAARAIRTINRDASIAIVSDEAEPAYSACVLPHYVGGEIERNKVIIKNPSEYSGDRIELLSPQRVTGVKVEDRRVVLEHGSLDYDKLIVATGSTPIISRSIHAEKDGVFTFKSLTDADKIARWQGRSAVIVGSGAIGLEAGMALKKKGYQVTVIELLDHILPRAFDEYPAGLVKQILRENGIGVLDGERLVEVLGTKAVSGVETDRRTIACDTVVLAMGMKPRGISLFDTIETGENGGISVNDRMETCLTGVFACGDCVDAKGLITGRPMSSMLWHNARRQGQVAGCNAAGRPLEYNGSINVTGLNLFGIQAVSVGISANAEAGDVEVIEREREGGYQRVILQKSEVAGVQSINWPEDLGYLMTSIVRKEKVTGLRDALAKRKPPLRVRPFSQAKDPAGRGR